MDEEKLDGQIQISNTKKDSQTNKCMKSNVWREEKKKSVYAVDMQVPGLTLK